MSISNTHELRLYDRSRATTDWQCPRKRFLQYEWGGRGIVPEDTALELYLGTTIHDGLSAIARGVEIDLIADAARTQVREALAGAGTEEEVSYASEQAALVEGLLRGFYRHVWPSLIAKYPVIHAIEQEMVYEHDGLSFMSKPDLVLGSSDGSDIIYVEYKSTSSKKDSWVNSWGYAVQLHSTIRAIEQSLNLRPTGVIVQGLYKGFESYGKQSSPFCYAYHRAGVPPFNRDEWSYEYKPGLKRYPIWEREGGVKAWVEGMPEQVLADQFPRTPVIFIKQDLIDAFFKQRAIREHEIDDTLYRLEAQDKPAGVESILNEVFPQRFDQCAPYFGKPCTYRNLCHGNISNPLEHGFALRESHHELEAEQHRIEDSSRD